MTDAYFYVNIPYHRPATPSFFRLLQRWAGPLLLGTVLAALAWRQDHATPSAPATATQPAAAVTADPQDTTSFNGYTAAADQPADQAQLSTSTTPARAGAHPSLIFHNCSVPRMEVRKDRNELISGVASVSSCDEAKVTLWDSSR